jgi:hypothetical protein
MLNIFSKHAEREVRLFTSTLAPTPTSVTVGAIVIAITRGIGAARATATPTASTAIQHRITRLSGSLIVPRLSSAR